MSNTRMSDEGLADAFGRRPSGLALFEPGEFGYHCPDGHTGPKLTWSEFNDHVWCFICEKDFHSTEDCYVVKPEWMSEEQWQGHLAKLPTKPEVRPGQVPGTW